MQSYFGFVVFVLIIGFVIYLAVTSDSFLNFSSFKAIVPKSLFMPLNQAPLNSTSTGLNESKKSSSEIIKEEKTSPSPTENQPEVIPPKGFTKEQLSPYYQKIRISSFNRSFYFSDNFTSLTLSTDYREIKEPINISGWYLKSNRGIVFNVPQAVNDFNPSLNVLNKDIVLASGESVTFYNTESPIRFNLRLNKCIGYLNNSYSFKPSLPRNCPYLVDRSEIITFSGRCQSFIMSLPSCYQPKADEINTFSIEPACRQVLDNLNYGGCYLRYRNDDDFFSKEWWVWLGNGFNIANIDQEHDRLLLFDKQNLLVAEYIY
jgi:hypothetical protein